MKKNFLLIFVICVCIGLVVSMAAYAQEPEQGSLPDQVEGLGLTDLPDSGKLYTFTGVINNMDPSVATSVHCSNNSTETVYLEVYFFPREGGSGYVKDIDLKASETKTVSTKNTFYEELYPNNSVGDIMQGSGLVRVVNPTGKEHVICTAQVLDSSNPDVSLPSFISNLEMFKAR